MLALSAALLAAVPTLSLPDALARTDHTASVVVARAEAEVKRLEIGVARAPAAPVATLGTTRYSAREEISVSQEVRWGGERRHAVHSAAASAEAAEAAARLSVVEARRLVRQAWYELAAAEDAEALAREATGRATQLLESVRARFEGGRVPRLDVVRTEAESARIAAQGEAALETRRSAWAHLSSLLDLDPRAEGATDGSRPALLAESEEATLEAADGERHPAVAAAQAGVRAAAASRDAARSRLLPGLSFAAGVNADDPGLPGPDWTGSVSLTLPFGSTRGRPALRVAEAELAVREAELITRRREVAEARQTAYRKLRAAAAQLRAYESQAVPAAEEAARLTREAYELGRGDIFRVVESERSLLEARAARLQLYKEAKLAEADLLASAGESE